MSKRIRDLKDPDDGDVIVIREKLYRVVRTEAKVTNCRTCDVYNGMRACPHTKTCHRNILLRLVEPELENSYSGATTSSTETGLINPDHYKEFGVEVIDIIKFVLDRPENKGLSPFEAACMYAELKYRLRAGMKEGSDIAVDMQKAMKHNEYRKGEANGK